MRYNSLLFSLKFVPWILKNILYILYCIYWYNIHKYAYTQREQFGARAWARAPLTLPWRLRRKRWCCDSERWTRTRIRMVVYRPWLNCRETTSFFSAEHLRFWSADGIVSVAGETADFRASLANAAIVCHYYCPTASHTAASWLVHFGTSAVRALQCRLIRWEKKKLRNRNCGAQLWFRFFAN